MLGNIAEQSVVYTQFRNEEQSQSSFRQVSCYFRKNSVANQGQGESGDRPKSAHHLRQSLRKESQSSAHNKLSPF